MRKKHLQLFALSLLLIAGTLTSGCAVVINMPTARFDTPEAQGELGKGYFGAGATYSREVTVISNTTAVPPSTSVSQNGAFNLPLALGVGILERLDVEIKPQFAAGLGQSPWLLRAKYQILGEPRKTAKAGVFNLAVVAGGGWYPFSKTDSDTLANRSAKVDVNYWAIDSAVIAGYRVNEWFMPYFSTGYTYYAVTGSDVVSSTTGGATNTYSISAVAHHVNLNAGLGFDVKHFLARLEGGVTYGASGGSASFLPALGAMVGFQW